MSKEVVKRRPMSAQMKRAALLDAQGLSHAEIVEQENLSPKTLSTWRKREDYIALREKFEAETLERLNTQLTRVKIKAISYAERALEQALEALQAVDASGDYPLWDVRREARRDLLNWPGVKGQLEKASAGATGVAAGANAVVTIMFKPEDVGLVIDQDPEEVE